MSVRTWIFPAGKFMLSLGIVMWGGQQCYQWSQRYVAHGLADRVVGEQQLPARSALAKLERFEEVAIEALMTAAAADQERIAIPAREQLNELTREWRELAFAPRGAQQATENWRRLLVAMAHRAPQLTTAGRRWAAKLLREALALDEALTPEQVIILAEASDLALQALRQGTPPVALPLLRDSDVNRYTERNSLPDAVRIDLAAHPAPSPVAPAEETPPADWNPQWQAPKPIDAPAVAGAPTAEHGPPLDDRQLLEKLLEYQAELLAEQETLRSRGPRESALVEPVSPEFTTLRATLADRGYRGVALDDVRLLVSKSAADRRQLVDRLLTRSSAAAPRLLMLLAHDESPEVRLAALTALGSSDDAEVVRAAWNLALRDSDPAVANLARELGRR